VFSRPQFKLQLVVLRTHTPFEHTPWVLLQLLPVRLAVTMRVRVAEEHWCILHSVLSVEQLVLQVGVMHVALSAVAFCRLHMTQHKMAEQGSGGAHHQPHNNTIRTGFHRQTRHRAPSTCHGPAGHLATFA
jgi:hypothetical protein